MKTEEQNAERVAEIIDEYLAEQRAGRAPAKQVLLGRHPDLAADLDECLKCLALVEAGGNGEAGPSAAERLVGGMLGDFRILREIGRGGMGVVYEAEQVSLGRRVALKVLPFAAVFDERHLQRFRNEAQAAAFLHHTNIVPVFAVGNERGVHYYAMQFIEGRSLAQVAEELKRGPAEPSQPLSVITQGKSTQSAEYCRAVAQIGIQAAEALAHAHERGVIHRDIKPGNLMVDALGHLWVTDFGLASFERNLGLTMTGDLLGTVRYMSPEQALAKRVAIDHRTDIYSLGVTLYELLTLAIAFPGDNPQEVMRQIAFRDAVAARRINPAIPVDLETILIKTMAKDPAGRYESADDLAADLRRFLNHESVKAKRPSLFDVVGKWAARHKVIVAAALVVLAVTSAALGISAYRIGQEQHKTKAALRRADQSLRLAHGAVEKFLVEIGIDGLEDRPLPSPARQALLEQALRFYETTLRDRAEASVHLRCAVLFHVLHRYSEALEACDQALRLEPDGVRALIDRGHMLRHEGRFAESRQALEAAIAADPNAARAWAYMGIVLVRQDHVEEGLAAYDRALRLDPTCVMAHVNRGATLDTLGRLDDALKAYDRAIQLDPHDAAAHSNRGTTLEPLGRLDDALDAYDRAIQLDPTCAAAHANRAGLLQKLGRVEDSLAAYDRAIDLDPTLASLRTRQSGRALRDTRPP